MFECRGGLDLVGHCHGVHEIGDGVAVDEGGLSLCVDGDDATGEGIALCGWGRAMAGGKRKCADAD